MRTYYYNVAQPGQLEMVCVPLCEGCVQRLRQKPYIKVFDKLREAEEPCDHTFIEKVDGIMGEQEASA